MPEALRKPAQVAPSARFGRPAAVHGVPRSTAAASDEFTRADCLGRCCESVFQGLDEGVEHGGLLVKNRGEFLRVLVPRKGWKFEGRRYGVVRKSKIWARPAGKNFAQLFIVMPQQTF